MMKRFAVLLAPVLLSACAMDVLNTKPEVNIYPDGIQKDDSESYMLQNPLPNARATMKAGDSLSVWLDANPTTGLWWSDPIHDEDMLTLIKEEYFADPAPKGVVGSGGTTIFVFQAVKPGTTKITSEYSRGPGSDEVYEKLNVTIEVTE